MEQFLIQIDRPLLASKARSNYNPEESHLLLLLSKEHTHVPFLNYGILCTIIADNEDTLRVRLDISFGWSSQTMQTRDDLAIHCFTADISRLILIEMSKF